MIQKRTTTVTSFQPDHLEVVVQRRHPQHPFTGGLERGDLGDHRQRLEDEHAAEDDEEELGVGRDGETGERAAEGERAGVAHEDLGGRRVPPEEPEAGAHARGGDEGEVVRVAHLVALDARVGLAVLVVRPDADEDVGAEDHRRDAGREPVETVGEVHAVGRAGDHDVGEDDEEDDADDGAAPEGEADVRVAHERDEQRGGRAVLLVGELQRQPGEDDADEGLPDELLLRRGGRGCAAC